MPGDSRVRSSENYLSKAGGLLHSLVPRAQVFCYYDKTRNYVWSTDSADDYELDNFVAELPEELFRNLGDEDDVLRRTLTSGRTVLGFPVLADGDSSFGMLIALFSRNAGKSSTLNPKMLKSILQPAIELIAENLQMGAALSAAENKASRAKKVVELIYEIDDKICGASRRHSNLAELVGRSGRHTGVNYSVLLIPPKRIRISATHSGWKTVNRKVLDRYLIEQLLPKLDGTRTPRVFDIPAIEGADDSAESGYEALLCPVVDTQGNVEGVLAQLGRVDGSRFSKSDQRFMAHIGRKVEYVIERSFDTMTGLMNRPGFETQLYESFKTLESDDDAHQIIYFDLDNLQLVNDSFGRDAGDEVILRFASVLADDLPKTGVLSRLTGDDFCLLLTHATSDEAVAYASAVRGKSSALRYLQGDKSLQATISIGIAEVNSHSIAEGNVLTTARMACEAAKDNGRDRVEIFDQDNRSVVRRYDDMHLVSDIQKALDADELELLAQPIACLSRTASGIRYEILLRMSDGDGGKVPSSSFFSAAERYGLMPQIDRWVASRTIARLAELSDELVELDARFSINLSGQSLSDDEIAAFVEEEIDQSGLSPSTLSFEITESAAVSNAKKAQAFIDRLRHRGCEIALDDFGAGLSSFAYLKKFNVDTLKIDGGFIRDITKNRISESMVAAVTQVAKVMELETIAEYVETKAARKFVKKLGVDYAQGHFIGRPEPLESVLEELYATEAKSTA